MRQRSRLSRVTIASASLVAILLVGKPGVSAQLPFVGPVLPITYVGSSNTATAGSTVCTFSDTGQLQTAGPDSQTGGGSNTRAFDFERNIVYQTSAASDEWFVSGDATAAATSQVGFAFATSSSDGQIRTLDFEADLTWNFAGNLNAKAEVRKGNPSIGMFFQHARGTADMSGRTGYSNLANGTDYGRSLVDDGTFIDVAFDSSVVRPWGQEAQSFTKSGSGTAVWLLQMKNLEAHYFYFELETAATAHATFWGVGKGSSNYQDLLKGWQAQTPQLKVTVLTPGWVWTTCTG
jgi:hypothetical protein